MKDMLNIYGKLDKQDLLDFFHTYFYRPDSSAEGTLCRKISVYTYTKSEARDPL